MSKEIEKWKREDYDKMGKETLIQIMVDKDDYIEELTTPPTEQEVCEALGEYYDVKVMFENNEFYYKGRANNIRIVGLTARKANDEVIKICVDFYPDFPPHLVEMIGKFYKGKVKENE